MIKLTEHQQKVYDAFDKANTDIDIAVLYTRVYGDPGHKTVRDMQMRLGPNFAALNAKLFREDQDHSEKIEPGDVKRTYRLIQNEE